MQVSSFSQDPPRFSALTAGLLDSESLLRLAEEHGVLAQLAAALDRVSGLPRSSAFFDSLRARRRAQMLSALALTAELFRFLEFLRQARVEAVVVKGPVLSHRAYGDSSFRQYGDVDLLVRHTDVRRAAEIVSSTGYESRISIEAIRDGKIPGQYLFRRPGTGVLVELHTERTLRYFPRALPIEEFFQRKTSLFLDGHSVPALSAEDEFILISIHGAKHFWERLMWISDVAAMVHNHPELDWKCVRESSAGVGAERMVRLALLLAEHLLGVPVPAEMKRDVANDLTCSGLVREIETWLPYAGYATPPVAQRAIFRFRMRGDALAGATYLTRLFLSTTEEDWSADGEIPRSRFSEILRRPFRLAKKYRRSPDS